MPSILVGILNIIDFERTESLITAEFVTMLLSGLPLQNDEPLHLYYHVTRLIGSIFSPLKLFAVNSEVGIHGAYVDEQLRSVLKEVPDRLPTATVEQCLATADKIEILIHFKQFVQNAFNIADHSLETWNPHVKSSIVCSRKDSLT
ncbi:hypothetical protein BVRB_026740, partial [Beta vulgaris subsp. vulgaris]